MKLQQAINKCHIRSAIYRASNPDKLYWKNHSIPLQKRIPFWDRFANDWIEFDPREVYDTSIYG